ncbi:SusC/RagA family TonB-linked outer membrane protein [Sphingobacterium corticibacterium]|uniref:SusC/RagA family TonB-linked outer membrane protein n=1 Tax=Sphingobacterium corticibacterium TaxID=2484746 RepID=A0A4Q6XMA3_9SPHI|nr:SusC/RagA family TonB-linked outer membrane protein [Sphingobacterium corticibacterium]RZF58432.1 SusC/RagA family TonB-linked outer membrane protein [Sphingobacterium corticibacterium]
MKQKLLSLIFVLTCLVGVSVAQNRQVSGRVTSAGDGTPIAGVSVAVVGTSNATQTDGSGNYSIQVPGNDATLAFSYIGYDSQRVAVGSRAVVNVQLAGGGEALEEVVVTAMGITREKRALATATQEVKGEALTQAANSNLATAIQGKVSGVEVTPSSGMPGASAKITIRGARSFTGDNTPLYVVDGMPITSVSDVSTGNSVTGSDYSARGLDIDPNDIESINILKGQAASALYGMRASNGAIIITTKSGKNAPKGRAQISFNSNVSFDRISVLPDFQTTYAQGSQDVNTNYVPTFNPTTSTVWGPRIDQLHLNPSYGGETDNQYTQRDGRQPGKYYVPQRATAGLDPWATPQAYDNAKEFFDVGNTYNNSLNIMQGFDKGHYSMSLGSTNSQGIVPSTGLDRYNAKLATQLSLSDQWTTGFSGNYVNSSVSKQTSANDGIIATIFGAPASYDLKGIPNHVADNPYSQVNYRGGAFDNPYWATQHNSFTEKTQRFFGNGFAQFATQLADNQKLTLKYQLGVDSYTANYTDLWGYGKAGLTRGQVENYHYSVTELNSLATAVYNWEINEDLVFDAMIGNEIVDRNRRYDYGYGGGFNFAGWNHMNNATTYTAEQNLRHTRTFGLFGNLNLAYKNMLYLNVTGRNDVVSNMPRDSRSFFYPSVSASFVFTELEGLQSEVLNFGKLRASYAEVGQAGNYYESYYSTPTYSGGFSTGFPIIYPLGSTVAFTPYPILYDPELVPQNTRSYEIGTDLTFLNGLFDLSYTFSRQDVKNQIFEVPLGGSSGFQSVVTNGGKIHTNAHETTLSIAPFREGDFRWDFAFNFTKIDNYVDELAEGVESIFLGGFVEPQVRAGIGEKFPVIYGNSYLRNDAGQIVVDARGLPQIGEERVIGSVAPDFILGFNTRLEYKKVRLGAVLDWKQGGQMLNATSSLLDFYGTSQKSADFRGGDSFLFEKAAVKETSPGSGEYVENDISIDPSRAFDYFNRLNNISESSIRGTSFVKLREITVGYPVYSNTRFTVDVNAFARNLILWSELKGFDPEASQGNTNMSGAFERFSLPGASSYGLGVNIKF